MNTKIINTAVNLKSVLAAKSTYFIIKESIQLEGILYNLGIGSVIEFAGGCFIGTFGTSLNLNGGQIIAAPYPIFTRMIVTGFSNSKVYAEWFNDNNSTTPHTYINRALSMAKGCPVVLTNSVYKLKGSIVFPSTTPSTLIVNGTLEIDDDNNNASWHNNPIAIIINTSDVNIKVNKIKFPIGKDTLKDKDGNDILDDNGNKIEITVLKGTAIQVYGEVSHININVDTIIYPERGIDISSGRSGQDTDVSYLNVRFQNIYAKYGICMGMPSDQQEDSQNIKFTRSFIYGGRLHGDYGVYLAGSELPASENTNNRQISEVCFANIGLEALSATPIYLRHASRLRFENIRMAESLPEKAPWFDLSDVSWLRFDIHGDLNADQIAASGICDNVIIKSSFLRTTDWINTPFDTLVINSAWIGTPGNKCLTAQKAFTNSISPFPMANSVLFGGDLQTIQPTINFNKDGTQRVKVLPQMFQFKGETATINLDGMWNYAPCIYYFSVDSSNPLTFVSDTSKFYQPGYNDGRIVVNASGNKLQVKEPGLYKMMWYPVSNSTWIKVSPVESIN